jgi:hypothetical protein
MAASKAVKQIQTLVDGKPWIGEASMARVDGVIKNLLPTAFKCPSKKWTSRGSTDPSKKLSAVDAILRLKTQYGKQIENGSWAAYRGFPGSALCREEWALGVVSLILSSSHEHRTFHALAIEDSSVRQGEVEFLVKLLPLLGFVQRPGFDVTPDENGFRNLEWTRDRHGGSSFLLCLECHATLDRIKGLDQSFAIRESNSAPPDMKAFAVVSSPVHDARGQDANEKVNHTVEFAFVTALARAEAKGWMPEDHWTVSEEANDEWDEFFDLPCTTRARAAIVYRGNIRMESWMASSMKFDDEFEARIMPGGRLSRRASFNSASLGG